MPDSTTGLPQEQTSSISIPEIFRLLGKVEKKLAIIQRMTVQASNLTPSQYYILKLLWVRDGRPFKEFADALMCSPATVTGIIDTLEKKMLVRRGANPDDRRSLLAMLTSKGKDLQDTTPDLEDIFGHCCAGLSPMEFQQLGELLHKLDTSLECKPPALGDNEDIIEAEAITVLSP